MTRTRLIAVLVAITAIAIVAVDAQAVYHPTMGRFLQRDPGAGGGSPARTGTAGPAVGGSFAQRDPTGSNQYADGMTLYQYVGSNPIVHTDPSGLRIVVISGLLQSSSEGSQLAEKIRVAVKARIDKYDATGNADVDVRLLGGGGQGVERQMVEVYNSFRSAKCNFPCSLEQFVVVGHSDGATAIYRSLHSGAIGKGSTSSSPADDSKDTYTPAFIGMVDLVRLEYDIGSANTEQRSSHRDEEGRLIFTGGGQVWIPKPAGTTVYSFYQTKGTYIFPVGTVYGRPIVGGDRLTVLDDVGHFDIWKDDRVHKTIAEAAAEAYERRIRADGRPWPWQRGGGEPRGKRW